ncbi:MAG: hypothetical protein U1D25_02290 [Hydrogenophaga sp.]|uniref:hypothetical protein n=1 Tax=Hydrogenophaga sp. TaxID=1904254 RepID=UPI002ABC525D|nr:hypothetical protein [Hydrogenophaga sp.]MDZ4186926.1 hypothetical protein [Hydrogenophaga sp.]
METDSMPHAKTAVAGGFPGAQTPWISAHQTGQSHQKNPSFGDSNTRVNPKTVRDDLVVGKTLFSRLIQ